MVFSVSYRCVLGFHKLHCLSVEFRLTWRGYPPPLATGFGYVGFAFGNFECSEPSTGPPFVGVRHLCFYVHLITPHVMKFEYGGRTLHALPTTLSGAVPSPGHTGLGVYTLRLTPLDRSLCHF